MIKVRLKRLLAAQGKTYYWLSQQTDVDHTVYLRLGKGQTESVMFRAMEGACIALGCTPNDLFEFVPGLISKPKAEKASKKRGKK